MLASLLRRPWLLGVSLLAVVALIVTGAVAVFGGSAAPPRRRPRPHRPARRPGDPRGDHRRHRLRPSLVVYNGRSHYGDEKVFREFEQATGVKIELRGGTGPELFERLRSEGADTPADVLVTTDLANLWRAEQAGLLQGVTSPTLRAQIPESRRDAGRRWWALSTRLRVPVVSTERVPAGAVTSYADLGDPRFAGRTCLRTSQQRVQPVAGRRHDRQAGPGGHRDAAALVDGQQPEDPRLGRRDARGDGRRRLRRGPEQPLLPGPRRSRTTRPSRSPRPGRTRTAPARTPTSPASAWCASSDAVPTAVALMEWLTSPPAQEEIVAGSEFAANPEVPPPRAHPGLGRVKQDPIDAERAGPLLADAVAMMLAVGWT